LHKKRLSPSERHTIEAAMKGEPFPGLVYRRGEFSIVGNMLVLPGIGRIPFLGDVPPKGSLYISHIPKQPTLRVALFDPGHFLPGQECLFSNLLDRYRHVSPQLREAFPYPIKRGDVLFTCLW
jgi:hypothetical protein